MVVLSRLVASSPTRLASELRQYAAGPLGGVLSAPCRTVCTAMIDRACNGAQDIDAIVVHSFSRFMRDSFAFEFYLRKLSKHGVALISITQDVVEGDPAQVMMRKVIALFDEYQSKENAKHVLRAMKENARQGYWNGSRPPFGYTTVEVEPRWAKQKETRCRPCGGRGRPADFSPIP